MGRPPASQSRLALGSAPQPEHQLEAEDVENPHQQVEADRWLTTLELAHEALGDPGEIGDIGLPQPQGAASLDHLGRVHHARDLQTGTIVPRGTMYATHDASTPAVSANFCRFSQRLTAASRLLPRTGTRMPVRGSNRLAAGSR